MKPPPISVAEPALHIDQPGREEWDREVDVLVVGFGAAGACAALAARAAGADVLIVDRFDGGGSSAYSGGVVYAGATAVQQRLGIADDTAAMRKYLEAELGDAVRPDTLRRFCEGSAADVAWLMDLGMPYTGGLTTGKVSYPAEASSLYFSGNEKQLQERTGAAPAPRGHRAIGQGYTGQVFFGVLKAAVERAGIPVVTHAPVARLIVAADGAVIGAVARPLQPVAVARHQALYASVTPLKPLDPAGQDRTIATCRELEAAEATEPLRIRARRGVIIAAGGYVFNHDMLRKNQPFLAAHHHAIVRLGSIGDDGSGIELGQSVGAAVGKINNLFINRNISPPDALLKGIAVNLRGERFLNEDAYTGDFGQAIAAQPEGKAWLILDRGHLLRAIGQCLTADRAQFKLLYGPTLLNLVGGGTRVSRSIAGLARKLGIPPAALVTAVASNNAAAQAGHDPVGKLAEHLRPIRGAPYVAVNLSVVSRLSFAKMFTLGGLKVDEESGGVLDAQDQAIAGLFAAGRSAVGLCSVGYISGMSLADCVFSGRRAGRSPGAGSSLVSDHGGTPSRPVARRAMSAPQD